MHLVCLGGAPSPPAWPRSSERGGSASRHSSGTGPTDEPRSDPGGGLLLLNALLVVGGGAITLPQIRLRKTEPTSLLPGLDVRMEVRVLVVLPGILTTRLVLGRRGLL